MHCHHINATAKLQPGQQVQSSSLRCTGRGEQSLGNSETKSADAINIIRWVLSLPHSGLRPHPCPQKPSLSKTAPRKQITFPMAMAIAFVLTAVLAEIRSHSQTIIGQTCSKLEIIYGGVLRPERPHSQLNCWHNTTSLSQATFKLTRPHGARYSRG